MENTWRQCPKETGRKANISNYTAQTKLGVTYKMSPVFLSESQRHLYDSKSHRYPIKSHQFFFSETQSHQIDHKYPRYPTKVIELCSGIYMLHAKWVYLHCVKFFLLREKKNIQMVDKFSWFIWGLRRYSCLFAEFSWFFLGHEAPIAALLLDEELVTIMCCINAHSHHNQL